MNSSVHLPRRQAERLVELISREGSGFRAVLLGKRGEGKTDLLRQVHRRLFEGAEGPIPFFYTFQPGREEAGLARHFFASFCQQVRAFLMRQEELLWEPVAHLERELERPGLPLSLTEFGRSFQTAPSGYGLELAAGLPAQFAHLERRPVYLLFDEAQTLARDSPFWAALRAGDFCWLLTGRHPFLARMAGEGSWPLLRLEAFSAEEALGLAEKRCPAAGLTFSPEAWEPWFEMAGTSCWLLESLVDAAAARGQSLESVEGLGRVYARELSGGSLGNWLAARWEAAVPDRRERARAAEFLAAMAGTSLPVSAAALSPELWNGLVAEEWAEETPAGPRLALGRVERDWLDWVTACATVPQDRAAARILQGFLTRARQRLPRLLTEEAVRILRERLCRLPESGFPESWEWEGQEVFLPRIHSVAVERAGTAELFWCYGFREDLGVATPGVLLLALCEEAPSTAQLGRWRQQLDEEARKLPPGELTGPAARPVSGGSSALWLLLPPGTPLIPEASERRFSWEAFLRLWAGERVSEGNPLS